MPSFTRTLCVHFPREQWPGWRIAELNLRSSQPPPPPQSRESDSDSGSDSESVSPYKLRKDSTRLTVSVDPDTCTDYGSDSPVFRAFVTRDDRSRTLSSNELLSVCHPKTSIALKFALREDLVDDLVQEAQVYEGALRSLQGGVVPRCYGLFTGIGSEGQEIACLALEFWGESLTAPFKTLPIDVRIRILDSLGELHRCGLHHGDFAERNVLINDNDIRIIDFDQPVYHDCDSKTTFEFRSGVGQRIPDVTEFGCPALWEICRSDMAIWG